MNQTIALIRRIAAHNKGLKETERIRLIQAFEISLLTYSLPYRLPSCTELSKVNCLIRTIYKTALQIPQSTTTATLEILGIYSTAEELIEAQLIGFKSVS